MPAKLFDWCTITGCSRPHAGRGYCKFHWKRWRVYGDPLREPLPFIPTPCSVTGCAANAAKRGMCDTHYHRMRSWGDPTIVLKVKAYRGTRCSADGCSRVATVRGMCSMHRRRVTRRGDVSRGRSRVGYINRGGYRVIPMGGPKILEHRWIWQQRHGPIPKDYVIHHKNGNKLDNRLENLDLMSRPTHSGHHSPRTWNADGKVCKGCEHFLPLTRFYCYPNKKGRMVVQPRCKSCHNRRPRTVDGAGKGHQGPPCERS